jgi:hypothetical protein
VVRRKGKQSKCELGIDAVIIGFHTGFRLFFMQNRGVNTTSAGFKSARGLLVSLGFDPVGLWAARTVRRSLCKLLVQNQLPTDLKEAFSKSEMFDFLAL